MVMVKKNLGVALSIVLAIFMVFGGVVSSLSGSFYAYAAGKTVYIDGVNGNDSNKGTSAGDAVKSWDKARALLGTQEGTIFVAGTVKAEGSISTQASDKQSVKRADGFTGVMFEVPGGATANFYNIDVDGEDKQIDEPVIKTNGGTTLNFLSGAVFHDVGYDGWSEERPNSLKGGVVVHLVDGVNILVDGAEFRNNDGKGIFFSPVGEGTSGGSAINVHLTMKSGKVIGNKGWFYHNEVTNTTTNTITILNGLVRNNDASNVPVRYSGYPGRNGVVYVCPEGLQRHRSVDAAGIFDNKTYDLIYGDQWGDNNRIKFQGTALSDTSEPKMLGGGTPNWGEPINAGNGYYAYKSNPSQADKDAAANAATSIFENNGAIIDSNGTVSFGRFSSDPVPETPEIPDEPVTPTEPEKTPVITNTTAKLADNSASEKEPAKYELAADDTEGVVLSDTIEFKDLNSSKTYTVRATAYDADGNQVRQKGETVSGKTEGSVTISFDRKMSEGTYNIKAELLLDGKVVASHNDKFDTISERAIVTREEPEEPTEPETPTEPENPTPEEPTEPETPTEPENPTPEEPTEPETPTEPENPTPDEPTEPETPTEPENPTPDEPTEPENPTPEQPTEPENPTPEEPAQEEPTTPAEEKVSVKISKTDMAGTEIEGAEIVIKDADGNEILCWTSDKTVKSFEVAPGTYTLEETNAPEGYQRVETKIEFEVAADGTVTVKTTAVDPAGACEVIDGVLVLKDEVKEKVDPAYEAPENDSEEHTVTVPPAEVEEEEPAVLGVYDAADEIKTADNTNGTSSGSKTKSANTGDSNELVLYLGMVMMAGVAATALIIRRRKAEK